MDAGDEFMSLVDEYVAAYPLASRGALSANCVRIAAAKLLLRKRLQRQAKAGTTVDRRIAWPGEGAAKLAAILLVLFVQECLVENQTAILGVGVQAFYRIMSALVRESQVSREELMAELIQVDDEGSATTFASSAEVAKLWSDPAAAVHAARGGVGAAAALQVVKEVLDEKNEWSDDSMLPESAMEGQLAGKALTTKPLLRRKLFLRSMRFRMACAGVSVLWFFAVEFICVSRFYGEGLAHAVVFVTASSFGTLIAAASFPNDLSSRRRFTLLPSAVTAIGVW